MNNQRMKVLDMTYIALSAVLIAVCSWISIPFFAVPFTLQTFAVFLVVGLLGGKRGTIAVLLYVLMAAINLPVLSGFRGGISALLSPTGGYVVGFIAIALIMWGGEKVFGRGLIPTCIAMVIGLIACYILGTAWFMYVYSTTKEVVALNVVLVWCVYPFIIPDLVKIGLALVLSNRLKRIIK